MTRTTLLVLVGPKGSGKTHIGAVVEARLGVRFIRVEPIFCASNDTPEAFMDVEKQIDRELADTRVVAIESTGIATEQIRALKERYQRVLLIRVYASAETCFRRFKARDASAHIPVSDDRFRQINERAAQASFNWDCELDNDSGLTEEEIAEAVAGIL